MVRETQKLTFNLELISKEDKGRTVANNIGRTIVAKKSLSIGSNEVESIDNSDIFDVYKDPYLKKKKRENLLLKGIEAENGLKAKLGAKKADGTDPKLTCEENAIIKALGNSLPILLDFEFFKQPISPYYLEEDLVVTIDLSKSEKIMLCSDNTATFKITDIALEYDVIIDPVYTDELSIVQRDSSYPYTSVENISNHRIIISVSRR